MPTAKILVANEDYWGITNLEKRSLAKRMLLPSLYEININRVPDFHINYLSIVYYSRCVSVYSSRQVVVWYFC